jgi:hypothetical protein
MTISQQQGSPAATAATAVLPQTAEQPAIAGSSSSSVTVTNTAATTDHCHNQQQGMAVELQPLLQPSLPTSA